MSEVEAGHTVPENDASVAEPEAVQSEDSTPSNDEAQSKDDGQSRVQKRINQLTWEKHEAERRAKELEDKLQAASESRPDPVQAIQDIPVPNYTDFPTDEDYQAALQRYNVQTFERLQQQTVLQQEQQAAERERNERRRSYQEKIASYASTHDGFVEAISNSNVHVSDDIAEILETSDKAGELTHWLAENADEALRINNLPTVLAARELGRIEATLDAVAPKKVSDAPPPMTEVAGSDTQSADLRDDMDIDEWMARRNAQRFEKYGTF